jgi:hypothetical protein
VTICCNGVYSVSNALTVNTTQNDTYSFGTIDSLTDGAFGPAGASNSLCIASGTVTYYLDTTVVTSGCDIASIDTYSGWASSGRVNQNYTVSFRQRGTGLFGDPIRVSYTFSGSSTPATHAFGSKASTSQGGRDPV